MGQKKISNLHIVTDIKGTTEVTGNGDPAQCEPIC